MNHFFLKTTFLGILGSFLGILSSFLGKGENIFMRQKNIKTRCEKRKLPKFKDICRTYDAISYAYADILVKNEDIREISCNVLLDGLPDGTYTSDFVCVKENGDLMVRECVYRKHLTKPMTIKLLDASKSFWQNRGVVDWGIVIDMENLN